MVSWSGSRTGRLRRAQSSAAQRRAPASEPARRATTVKRCTLSAWRLSQPRPRSSSNRRCVDRRSRCGSLASFSRIWARTSTHAPSFGAGRTPRSYLNAVLWPGTTQHRPDDAERLHDLLNRQALEISAGYRRSRPRTSSPKPPLPGRPGQGETLTHRAEGSRLKRGNRLVGSLLRAISQP